MQARRRVARWAGPRGGSRRGSRRPARRAGCPAAGAARRLCGREALRGRSGRGSRPRRGRAAGTARPRQGSRTEVPVTPVEHGADQGVAQIGVEEGLPGDALGRQRRGPGSARARSAAGSPSERQRDGRHERGWAAVGQEGGQRHAAVAGLQPGDELRERLPPAWSRSGARRGPPAGPPRWRSSTCRRSRSRTGRRAGIGSTAPSPSARRRHRRRGRPRPPRSTKAAAPGQAVAEAEGLESAASRAGSAIAGRSARPRSSAAPPVARKARRPTAEIVVIRRSQRVRGRRVAKSRHGSLAGSP